MARLFVAIDIPERIIDDIIATYMAIPGAKWIDEEHLHITLRFIGEVGTESKERISSTLNTVAVPPFSLMLKGVGYFPPRRDPRILWVGISGNHELMRLQSKIETALIASGIGPDIRKFHPHVTIARLNNAPPEKVAHYLTAYSLFATEPFEVSEFHLYLSTLTKTGAYYEKIKSFRLQ